MLIDFHRTPDGEWYEFGVKASAQGDFSAAIAALKTIPLANRGFDDETKLWTVRISPEAEQLLTETFANGQAVVETVKSQLSLF
jgi:hypothetical protein